LASSTAFRSNPAVQTASFPVTERLVVAAYGLTLLSLADPLLPVTM